MQGNGDEGPSVSHSVDCGGVSNLVLLLQCCLIKSFYRTHVFLGSDLWVLAFVSPRVFEDLTDVTLVDKDSNSIPTGDD